MRLLPKFVRTRRGVVTLVAILILALFLIRPEVQRLRARIVSSISLAVGRPVEVSSVSLQFLPQPGFELQNFVVYDDPNFSAEPILRSSEVTALLRVRSLFRGRLEIARLSLSEPSLNLVRNNQGHWNLENLLERAAKIPVAPTSKVQTESRPAFPYIEANDARINLKLGQEKKPYALTNADFTLWQDSENAWRMRLKAQPVRTDFNLSDTGILSVEGSWQRADTLRETPLEFNLQWERAQLGQMTKLVSGSDKGWRGGITISVSLRGKPADLAVETNASIQDFRRYDIMGGGTLNLTVQCTGQYSSANLRLSNLACRAPVNDGLLTLDGTITGVQHPRAYDLSLTASKIPIQGVVELARRCKKNIPADLIAGGKLDGKIRLSRDENSTIPTWEGKGGTLEVRLISRTTNMDLTLGSVPVQVATARGKAKSVTATQMSLGPVRLPLGATAPATLTGWFSRSGYNLHLQGDTQIQRVLRLARMVGVPASQPAADGNARVDLQVAGDWTGFAPPQVTGKAQLASIKAEVSGINAPLEITSANVLLQPEIVSVQNINATIAGSAWRGSLKLPRQCANMDKCNLQFDFQAKEFTSNQLTQVFSRKPTRQPWYRFLSPQQAGSSFLANVNAEGTLSANRILLNKVLASQVSAKVQLKQGRIRFTSVQASALGGKYVGDWDADFTKRPPQYSGKGSIQKAELEQFAQAMHDPWITGMGTVSYQVSAAGSTQDDLLSSAKATFDVEARDASLPHVTLAPEAGPLHIRRFTGRMLFHDSKLEIHEGKLESTSGIYRMSGTVSKGRSLDVQLLRDGAQGFNIRGTLAVPRVAPNASSETQAALKP